MALRIAAEAPNFTGNSTSEKALPELAYGSVWLVSAGDGDPRHLSTLAAQALSTADALIHDPGISAALFRCIHPSRYREAAPPDRAVERSIKLARDGWRVVHLVEGNAVERATACSVRFAEHGVPLRIVPNSAEPIDADNRHWSAESHDR